MWAIVESQSDEARTSAAGDPLAVRDGPGSRACSGRCPGARRRSGATASLKKKKNRNVS